MALKVVRYKWPRGPVEEGQSPLEEHTVKTGLDTRDAAETYIREHVAAFEEHGRHRENGHWWAKDAEFRYTFIVEGVAP